MLNLDLNACATRRDHWVCRALGAVGTLYVCSSCVPRELDPGLYGTGGRAVGGAGGANLGLGGASLGAGNTPGVDGVGGASGQSGSTPGNGGNAGAEASIHAGDASTPASTNPNCGAPSGSELPALELTPIASGFEEPVYVTAAPGDLTRLFVVEKPGRIRIIVDGVQLAEPFLDINELVQAPVEEMGLLGMAFHPRYETNRLFYVMYSTDSLGGANPAHTAVLAEYAALEGDPDRADVAERRVLAVAEPEGNHNGGNLQFGPDGFLYVGLGDGGGGGDQHGNIGNAQALDTLLGKMLRIDVDGRTAGPDAAYGVPSDNYFATNGSALPEIWSLGLRNPWRFSFDACSGDLYIGDVGQESLEEIDFERAGEPAGRNYGWRLMEADQCFEPDTGCDAANSGLVLPIATYGRETGQSITGGYVYWGEAIPSLRGTYLYADYQSAAFFALRMQDGAVVRGPEDITSNLNPGGSVDRVASFGQDGAGELYVVSFDGAVFRIDPE